MMLSLILISALSMASEPAKVSEKTSEKTEPKVLEVFLCGKERAKGHLAAEWALLDEVEGVTRLFHQGKELKEEEFDLASGENAWIVTLPGKEERKLVVNTKTKKGQLYLLEAAGKARKLGGSIPCKVP